MPAHDCETYDFPVKHKTFSYTYKKQIVQALGGTWQIAVQEAIDQAKARAERAGEKAMQKETCKGDCQRFIYVDISIDKIAPTWTPGLKGIELVIPISGLWQAGILCIKPPKSE
jgi:hypothetical protein